MRRTIVITLGLVVLFALSAGAADRETVEKWKDHTGDLPFVFSEEEGQKQAKFTGRPAMYFFTATW